jgi:hypothetical protein
MNKPEGGAPLHSLQYVIYSHHELQTMEFITLANIMAAAHAEGSILEASIGQDEDPSIGRFFQNLSFREEWQSFRRLWLRLMLCSAVDNFQTYLSEMLQAVFTSRPETLKSSEKVEVQDVLQYASIEEFIEASAERKVQNLTSRGFPKLRDYFVDRLGVRADLTDDTLASTTAAIALRNLFVHHRGRVTRQFLGQTSWNNVSLGDLIVLDRDDAGALCRNLQAAAKAFDEAFVSHFGIQTFLIQQRERTGGDQEGSPDISSSGAIEDNGATDAEKEKTP